MTIRIAILMFVVSFAAITSWLVMREPADSDIAHTSPAPIKPEKKTKPIVQEEKSQLNDEVVAISEAERYVRNKLNQIIIPLVEFESTSIEEAMDFLRLRARELDSAADDSRKGVSFIIRRPRTHSDDADALDADAASPPHPETAITGRLENKSIAEVLDFICEQAGCRWQITDHGILIVP